MTPREEAQINGSLRELRRKLMENLHATQTELKEQGFIQPLIGAGLADTAIYVAAFAAVSCNIQPEVMTAAFLRHTEELRQVLATDDAPDATPTVN
ncbi:MAG: hypothetical protein WBD78_07355 [Methylocella sp.]